MGQPYRSNQRHTASKTPSGKRWTWASTTGGSPSGRRGPSSSSRAGRGRAEAPGASQPEAAPRQTGESSGESMRSGALLLLALPLSRRRVQPPQVRVLRVASALQSLGLDEIGDLGAHLAEQTQGLGEN